MTMSHGIEPSSLHSKRSLYHQSHQSYREGLQMLYMLVNATSKNEEIHFFLSLLNLNFLERNSNNHGYCRCCKRSKQSTGKFVSTDFFLNIRHKIERELKHTYNTIQAFFSRMVNNNLNKYDKQYRNG